MKHNAVFSAALSALIMVGSAALMGHEAAAFSVKPAYPPYGVENIAVSPTAIGSAERGLRLYKIILLRKNHRSNTTGL